MLGWMLRSQSNDKVVLVYTKTGQCFVIRLHVWQALDCTVPNALKFEGYSELVLLEFRLRCMQFPPKSALAVGPNAIVSLPSIVGNLSNTMRCDVSHVRHSWSATKHTGNYPTFIIPSSSPSASPRLSFRSTSRSAIQAMPSPTAANPSKVLSVIHNLPKRMRSGQMSEERRARGKENVPPDGRSNNPRQRAPAVLVTSPSVRVEAGNQKWLPKDGKIIIKVWVPCTDDIWKFRVPEHVTFEDFRARVAQKVGFPVGFSSAAKDRFRSVSSESAFRTWVAGRVRGGRNCPLTAHLRH